MTFLERNHGFEGDLADSMENLSEVPPPPPQAAVMEGADNILMGSC